MSISRRSPSSSMAFNRLLNWGDTRSEDGAGRRVCISRIPPATTVSDLQKLFGMDILEGITIKNNFAFVQFKRPADSSAALHRTGDFLHGVPIKVRPYNKERPKPPRREDRDRDRDRDPHRDREREREYEYERERERRRSPPLVRRRHSRSRERSLERGRSRSLSLDRDGMVHRSNPFDRHGEIANRPSGEVGSIIQHGSNCVERPSQELVPVGQILPPNQHTFGNPTQIPTFPQSMLQQQKINLADFNQIVYPVPDEYPNYNPVRSHHPLYGQQHMIYAEMPNLPNEIALLLKLVVEQKTARNLSLVQIQTIMSYFESEKMAIEALNQIGISQNLAHQQQQQQQPQSQSQHQEIAQTNTAQANRPCTAAPIEESNTCSNLDPRLKSNNKSPLDPRLRNHDEKQLSDLQEVRKKLKSALHG